MGTHRSVSGECIRDVRLVRDPEWRAAYVRMKLHACTLKIMGVQGSPVCKGQPQRVSLVVVVRLMRGGEGCTLKERLEAARRPGEPTRRVVARVQRRRGRLALCEMCKRNV